MEPQTGEVSMSGGATGRMRGKKGQRRAERGARSPTQNQEWLLRYCHHNFLKTP